MSSSPTTGAQAPIVKQTREIRPVEDSGPLANLFDTARFEHMFRISAAMAAASLIPEHLRGIRKQGQFTPFAPEEVKANCFLVVNQSVRWGMDPFAVAPETYVVGGKLAYQGKLIAAVVNARAGLKGRLKYTFTGQKKTDDFAITVSGKFVGDDEPSEITLSVGEAKTENQMWKKDPEQKLVYSGVVKWARRYCPEIVLGIVTDDDLDRIAETAAANAKAADAREVPARPKFKKDPVPGDDEIPGLPPQMAQPTPGTETQTVLATDPEQPGLSSGTGMQTLIGREQAIILDAINRDGLEEIAVLKHIKAEYNISAASIRELSDEAAQIVLDAFEEISEALTITGTPAPATSAKETIITALRDMSIPQGPFMQGLAKINPEGASKNWTKVEQMPDALAEKILEEGLDDIIAAIRAKGVKL